AVRRHEYDSYGRAAPVLSVAPDFAIALGRATLGSGTISTRHPCKSGDTESVSVAEAVADGRPFHPWACKPVPQRGTPSAVPSNPNSRLGGKASPMAQGGVKMDAIYVGIDVSKDRLDVHVRPSGEAFAVARNGKGLNELIERLHTVRPTLVAVEAT